jgi:hypothetical protein
MRTLPLFIKAFGAERKPGNAERAGLAELHPATEVGRAYRSMWKGWQARAQAGAGARA